MLFCGSHHYLKNNIVKVLKGIGKGEKISFIVHTNNQKQYLKQFIVNSLGALFNAEFFTLIDISKRLTEIEPLQDFEREMILKKFLLTESPQLDGTANELGMIIQQLKEFSLSIDDIKSDVARQVIKMYERFKGEKYYDREDTHRLAIQKESPFFTDHLFIYGIKSVPPLHKNLFVKLKKLSKKIYIFLPISRNSGYYQNYIHFKEVIDFYESISSGKYEEETTDINITVANKIYRFEYGDITKNKNVNLIKADDEIDEVHFVANQIKYLTAQGVSLHKIAVVIPDLEKYIPYIKHIFEAGQIPYYLSEETRYIDQMKFRKLYTLLSLKNYNFSKELLLKTLSDFLYEDLEKLEEIILTAPITEGFNEWEDYLSKKNSSQFLTLLRTINQFPESSTINEYISILQKIGKIITDQEIKIFLEEIVENIQTSNLYADLFPNIDYKQFISILESFFRKEYPSSKPDCQTVQILTPIKAEGGNFSYLFFLNLNGNMFPSVSETGFITENWIDYPFHLLMQQLANFCNLFEPQRVIFLSYISQSVYGSSQSPSFLVKELMRITGIIPENTESINPEKLKLKHAHLLKEQFSDLKEIYQKLSKQKNPKKEAFIFNIKTPIPISPTKFSVYATCPYKFFFEEILNFTEEEIFDRKKIPPTKIGEEIHKVIEQFYKRIPENPSEKDVQKALNLLHQQVKKRLEPYLKELYPTYIPFEEEKINQLTENLKRFIYYDLKRLKTENRKVKKEFLEKKIKSEIFIGRVDRVEEDREGNYYIYDYKTTEKDINLEKEIKNRYIQLIIYKRMLNYLPVKNVGILAVNNRKGNYHFSLKDEKVLSETQQYLDALIQELQQNYYYPKENQWCDYCSFAYFCPKSLEDNDA